MCVLWAGLRFQVEFVGLAAKMLQKAGTAVWGGKAEGWEQMTHTSLRERESTVQSVKGRSFPSLLFSTHPQNLFHVFHQCLLLFQIVSQKTAPAEHLGPLCTNLCWCQQWKQNHISKYLSNSGPSILSRSLLSPFSFSLSFLFISFLLIYFSKAPAWDDAAFTHDVKCCFCRDY